MDGVVEEIMDEMIVIKPDEEQKDEYVQIPEGTPLEMIKAAGVVGMGGAVHSQRQLRLIIF